MAVSILHRITGAGLATIGAAMLVWWLYATARGAEAYAAFAGWATWKWALIVWVGLTWAFFQHALSGLRHFVMDAGAGYALPVNRFWSWMTLLWAILLTVLVWAWILYWRMPA